jgi:ESX secretion-associated protein EspL
MSIEAQADAKFPQHPQATETLGHLEKFNSLLEDQMRLAETQSFTGKDEEETVHVIIGGSRCVTGLYIEEGLLRLGAETVEERINEALQNAQLAASETIAGEQEQLLAGLLELTGDMLKSTGLMEEE